MDKNINFSIPALRNTVRSSCAYKIFKHNFCKLLRGGHCPCPQCLWACYYAKFLMANLAWFSPRQHVFEFKLAQLDHANGIMPNFCRRNTPKFGVSTDVLYLRCLAKHSCFILDQNMDVRLAGSPTGQFAPDIRNPNIKFMTS